MGADKLAPKQQESVREIYKFDIQMVEVVLAINPYAVWR